MHVDVRGTTLDRVLFMFVDSERRQKLPKGGKGSEGRQREKLFAAVVLGQRHRHGAATLNPVLFAPYVFASETPGWRAEREIYGFPQQFGRVRISNDTGTGPGELSVSSHVIERFGRGEMARSRRFLRLKKSGTPGPGNAGARAAQSVEVKPIGQAAVPVVIQPRLRATAADESFFARRPDAIGEASSSLDVSRLWNGSFQVGTVLSKAVPMIFLKQFRDIVYSDRACYQAIVEAALTLRGTVTALYLDDYTLTLDDVDSVPLRAELGIPAHDMKVEFAFRLDINELSLETADVISNKYWNPAQEVSVASEESRLPRYVDRGADAVWRQPCMLFNARLYGFGVPVALQTQEKLLRTCVNDVANDSDSTYGSRKFRLEPCPGFDVVMLTFAEYTRITSGNDDDRRLGATSYREFLAMQLALSADDEYPELDWFLPFIYLDTDAPRLAGREIFGYPKQFGKIPEFVHYFDAGQPIDTARRLSLSTTALRFGERQAAPRLMIRVEGPATAPAIRRRYATAQEMFLDQLENAHPNQAARIADHLAANRAPDKRQSMDVLNALLFSHIGNVFLKQFRDCTAPLEACYQAVCKTDTVPVQFHGGASIDPSGYRVTIPNLASDPLFSYVGGKETDDEVNPPVVFAYWADLDFELTNGRVIANPLEAPYVPDLSASELRLTEGPRPRLVRRSLQAELLELYPDADERRA